MFCFCLNLFHFKSFAFGLAGLLGGSACYLNGVRVAFVVVVVFAVDGVAADRHLRVGFAVADGVGGPGPQFVKRITIGIRRGVCGISAHMDVGAAALAAGIAGAGFHVTGKLGHGINSFLDTNNLIQEQYLP